MKNLTNMYRFSLLSFFILLCFHGKAFGWSLHYLITDQALRHPSMDFTDKIVKVEPLEAFLKDQRNELKKLFDDYYVWLKSTDSKRFTPKTFDPNKPTREMFLRAARLNPNTKFHLLNRVLPGEKPKFRKLPIDGLFDMSSKELIFIYDLEDVKGKEVSIRSVLTTFSDEPDWGIDQRLFDYPEYGYGKLPYGTRTGTSSRSPFHMQFAHENLFIKVFAPELLDGMVYQRINLFHRLSDLALKTGHPYWGYRFAAWILHYIQDVTQPYHSKAVPAAGYWYYVKFAAAGKNKKEKIKKETTQLLKNRHFLYEEFVGVGLENAYLTNKPLSKELSQFLRVGDAMWHTAISYREIYEIVMGHAAKHARTIDKVIIKTFEPKKTVDPSYDLDTDRDHDMRKELAKLDANHAKTILKETRKDFEYAGRATRTAVSLTR